jgi:hypothetical protein
MIAMMVWMLKMFYAFKKHLRESNSPIKYTLGVIVTIYSMARDVTFGSIPNFSNIPSDLNKITAKGMNKVVTTAKVL